MGNLQHLSRTLWVFPYVGARSYLVDARMNVTCLAAVCWRVDDKGICPALVVPQVPSDKLVRESPSGVAAAPLASKLLLRNLRVLNLGCQGKGGKPENVAGLRGQAHRQ